MPSELRIEPVPTRKRPWAMRFLLAGSCGDAAAAAQGRNFEKYVSARGPYSPALWWARLGRQCQAVAMVVESAGRTGMLLHCPVAAPGVEAEALRSLVRIISHKALEGGLSLVQAIVRPDARDEAAILTSAGYSLLVELICMQRDLASLRREGRRDLEFHGALTWRSYDRFDEEELARVIESTYEGSLDCPALAGVRRIEDVLAAHKASGVFTPQSWWIVDLDGIACGCILVNDVRASSKVEIVYVGVCPHARGRGLGRVMLDRAAREARRRGRSAMTLAVGNTNTYAIRAYEIAGFRRTGRRILYVMLSGAAGG